MTRGNIYQAKTLLPNDLKQIEQGKTVLVCRPSVPIAELRPVTAAGPVVRRPLGLARGLFAIPTLFDEPLPDDVTSVFAGRQP
jgi:antitoxin (DNA-binding transcriptional repressor) of toxin-antitoxin stability system